MDKELILFQTVIVIQENMLMANLMEKENTIGVLVKTISVNFLKEKNKGKVNGKAIRIYIP